MYSAPTAIMAGEQTLSGTGSQGRCSHEEGGLYSRLTFAVGPQGIGNRCIQFPLANHICGHRHGCQGVDGPCSSPSVRISAPSSNVAFMTSSTRAAQGLRRAGAIVMDGVRVALDVREELANAIRRAGVTPGLATIIVGRDAPSLRYVRNKATAAIAIGCDSFTRMLPESTTERQLLDVIAEFNADPQVHGIIVQLPLPDHIDPGAVLQSIDIGKDVDGFHPLNMGRLAQLKTWTWDSRSALQIVEDEYPAHAPLNAPCAPQACLTLLDKYDVPIEGRIAVRFARSPPFPNADPGLAVCGREVEHCRSADDADADEARRNGRERQQDDGARSGRRPVPIRRHCRRCGWRP